LSTMKSIRLHVPASNATPLPPEPPRPVAELPPLPVGLDAPPLPVVLDEPPRPALPDCDCVPATHPAPAASNDRKERTVTPAACLRLNGGDSGICCASGAMPQCPDHAPQAHAPGRGHGNDAGRGQMSVIIGRRPRPGAA